MADEETPEVEPAADAPASETPAEKPKRTRARAAKPAEAAEEAAPKPRRTRAAKPVAAAAEEAASDAPKPRRTRAAKPAAAAEEPAQDAPKPRRTRAAKAPAAAEETVAAPAPTRRPIEPPARGSLLRRRRGRRNEPAGAPPVVYATARYVRSSPRKARLVCDHIRGKSVTEARAILAFAPRAVARDWSKLLESAVANAEHNHELIGDELRIKEIYADAGPTIKRFTPRAQGRATPIFKRTSHLSIALTPKE